MLDKARPLLGASAPAWTRRSACEAARARVRQAEIDAGVFETILVLAGRRSTSNHISAGWRRASRRLYGSRPAARLGADVIECAARSTVLNVCGCTCTRHRAGRSRASSPSRRPGGISGLPVSQVVLVPDVVRAVSVRTNGRIAASWPSVAANSACREHEQLLLVDIDGSLLETERANVFAVSGTVVSTPAANGRILPGSTRSSSCAAAAAIGLEVSVGPLALCDLRVRPTRCC